MICIYFQDTKLTIEKPYLLSDILKAQGYSETDCFAIACNHTFVPRSAYASTILSEGDTVEVITPMQGG